jgi:ABC-type amino acid transport substrate-binding protein
LAELLQRSVGHVVKVIMHADDSDGLLGDLARELLALHARACDAGVADPVELAAWMVRFGFDDQDLFEIDPVRYASALGEAGLPAYRDAVDARRDHESFAVRYGLPR